jgi:hypothetical protein
MYREETRCTVEVCQHVTSNVIPMHLSGNLMHGSQRAWLQCYAASIEGDSVYTALDLDVEGTAHSAAPEHFATQEEARAAALKLIAVVEAMGLVAHLEITKSGGYRVWVFHHRLKAHHARDLGKLIVKRAGLHPKTEVFPAQAYLIEGQVGSAVFVPYNYHNAKNGRQVMIEPVTGDVRMVEAFVAHALTHRSDPARVAEIVAQATESGELKPPAPRLDRVAYDGGSPLAEPGERPAAAWMYTYLHCSAIGQIVDDCDNGLQISYGDWLRLATHLRPYGEWGRSEFHTLSSGDSRYDEAQADAIWDSINGGPTRCENMGCRYDPQTDCGLPDGKVSAVAFGYDFLRQVPVAYARRPRFTKI